MVNFIRELDEKAKREKQLLQKIKEERRRC